jgi:ankyrin repeat protein
MFAARYGLTDLVRDLIAFGADVNLNRSPDAGPLAIAAAEGYADVVNVLLDAGADVNARTRGGNDYAEEGGLPFCDHGAASTAAFDSSAPT